MITVFDSKGKGGPFCGNSVLVHTKYWPATPELTENLVLKVVSEIHDPVTTTDELIPSGDTSSYRSNPLGLVEFTLSRKDTANVGLAKEVQTAEKAREEGNCPVEALAELKPVWKTINRSYPEQTARIQVWEVRSLL